MNRAYKFRLLPNSTQEIQINKTFGCVRLVYNSILADNQEYYKKYGKSNFPQPTKYKEIHPFLKEIDALALANARINCQRAFKHFFRRVKQKQNPGFPKFKSKKHPYQSYTTNNQNGTVRIKENTIKLPKVGFVRFKKHRDVKGEIKSVTISKNPAGKYFISILTEQEPPITEREVPDNPKVLGIDMSFTNFAVLSNEEKINPPRWYYESEKKLARLQKQLSRKQKGSNNRNKARKKVAKLQEHIQNQRKDFLHKLSYRIAEQYDAVVVEDINLQHFARHEHWGKKVHDLCFGMFRSFLEYKFQERLKDFVKANKWYPSSKLCSNCGYKNTELQITDRTWICPVCKTEHDRDINAANNLANYYENTIGQELSDLKLVEIPIVASKNVESEKQEAKRSLVV